MSTSRQIAGSDIVPLTLTPVYAGSGALSFGLAFSAPSPITAVTHTFGYGTTTQDLGQLKIVSSSINNLMALEQTNPVGFAALTFRGKDQFYSDPTAVFEHGAIGWIPTFIGSNAPNKGALIIEASRLDGNFNGLVPPPTLILAQTGAIDATGGVTQTCGITNTSTTITSGTNLPANGKLITAVGVPAGVTLVSGGGTTSGVMSVAATATNAAVSANFSTGAYLQYQVLEFQGTGNVNFRNWDNSVMMSIDRYNKRVGLNTTTPTVMLDVNGAGRFNGVLSNIGGTTSAQAGFAVGLDYNVPTTGQTYTSLDNKAGCIFEPAGTIATLTVKMPPNPIAGQVVSYSTTQTITALTVSPNTSQVIRAGTTPTTLSIGGSFSMIYNVNTVWYPMT